MRLSLHFIVLGLALTPMVAAAAPISWSRYQVPETGAAVDIPTSIFSEQLGKPDLPDMQRNYTLRIITSVASFRPACAKDQRRLAQQLVCHHVSSPEKCLSRSDCGESGVPLVPSCATAPLSSTAPAGA
jgi:hypothetical protein